MDALQWGRAINRNVFNLIPSYTYERWGGALRPPFKFTIFLGANLIESLDVISFLATCNFRKRYSIPLLPKVELS